MDRVIWSRGMFLLPQHLQLQDKYHDEALQLRFALSSFRHWGFTELKIDTAALQNGHFKIDRCQGIFRDGFFFNATEDAGADDLPPSRPVPAISDDLDVYVAVNEQHAFDQNGGTAPRAGRYTVLERELRDDTGLSKERVAVARKQLQIVFGRKDDISGLQLLHAARVTSSLKIAEDFIPPCLDIKASIALMRMLHQDVEALVTKSKKYAADRVQIQADVAPLTQADMHRGMMLTAINTCLAELKHIERDRLGHPELLFSTLLRLAGALSTVTSLANDEADPLAARLPRYIHDDLQKCFSGLRKIIGELLDTVFPEHFDVVTLRTELNWAGPGTMLYGSVATPERFTRPFYIAVGTHLTNVQAMIRISDPQGILHAIGGNNPGVTLTPHDPPHVPPKRGTQYFLLQRDEPHWSAIRESRTLAIHVAEPLGNAQIACYVILD